MGSALYRAYQFFAALRASLPAWIGGTKAQISAQDRTLIQAILSTAGQQQLFEQMPANDRRHAIAVVRTLQAADFRQPALLQAALLHDVAKSMGQPIVYRVLIVLLESFWPALLARLSREPDASADSADSDRTDVSDQADPRSQLLRVAWWRRPFVIHARHPAIGAAWAQQAGCDPLAVKLIARHQETLGMVALGEDKLLAALQWADNLN